MLRRSLLTLWFASAVFFPASSPAAPRFAALGPVAGGRTRAALDGSDQHGLALPDGIYLIRLQSGAERTVGRAVLLRR